LQLTKETVELDYHHHSFLSSPQNFLERRKIPMLFSLQEKGQGMVEYALILVLIAIVVIVALATFGSVLKNTYGTINASIPQ
jgi:pilus assembly protein Flp/PilA